MAFIVENDRSGQYLFTQDDKKLFDFQVAAVDFCIDKLTKAPTMDGPAFKAVLGLDTGLGKTSTSLEIIRKLGKKTIFIQRSALIYQTVAALKKQPWEKAPSTDVIIFANDHKALASSIRRKHTVLVCNRVLPFAEHLRYYGLVVVDEAHMLGEKTLRDIYRLKLPTLFVTASPFERKLLITFGHNPRGLYSLPDACFLVSKTPRVVDLLGVAKVRFDVVEKDINIRLYFCNMMDAVIDFFKYHAKTAEFPILLYLVEYAMMQGYLTILPDFSKHLCSSLSQLIQSAGQDELHCIDIVGWHRPSSVRFVAPFAARLLKVLDTNGISSLPIEHWDVVVEAAGQVPRSRHLCPCCGLTNSEYHALYRCHVTCTSAADVLSEAGRASHGSLFSNAIVRCNTHTEVHELISNSNDEGLMLIPLVSTQTSAYRAKMINTFCSFGGVRGKLHTFMRGLESSEDPLTQQVMEFGFGEFRRIVSSFVVQKRILVADRTVDVGIDLHKYCDAVIVPRVMSSAVELQQLTGRLVRICTKKQSQGHVRVCTGLNKGTLDAVFLKHIHIGCMPDYTPKPAESDPRTRVEIEIQEEITSSIQNPILIQYLVGLYKRRRLSR
jgi:hypothetical protein